MTAAAIAAVLAYGLVGNNTNPQTLNSAQLNDLQMAMPGPPSGMPPMPPAPKGFVPTPTYTPEV